MEIMLFHAHSGLRYAVLLAGIGAVLVLRYGVFRGQPFGRAARLAGLVFTILLDVQVLLGLALVLTRPWYGALIGHIVLMVLALAAAHGLGIATRRATRDSRRYTLALFAIIIPLLLVVGGILAIGRSIV